MGHAGVYGTDTIHNDIMKNNDEENACVQVPVYSRYLYA
jgi:hypothetical protein